MSMYFSSKEKCNLRDYVKSFVTLKEGKYNIFKKYYIIWKNKPPDPPRNLDVEIEWDVYKKTINSYFNPHNVLMYPNYKNELYHILVLQKVYQLLGTEAMNIILKYASIYFEITENTWFTVLTPPSCNNLNIPGNTEVIGKRKPILYNTMHSTIWPEESALQKKASVSQLIEAVKNQRIQYNIGKYNFNIRQHMLLLEPILQELICRHRKVNYREAFKNHFHNKNGNKSPMTLSALMQIVDFFVRKVCPYSLFGNLHNKKKFMRLVNYVISKGEVDFKDKNVHLHISNIDISKVKWLDNVPDDKLKLYLLQKLLSWVLKHFIFALIKILFYVPKPIFDQNVLFFAKSSWQQLIDKTINNSLQSKEWKQINEKELSDIKSHIYAPLTSKFRLIVKNGKIRTLVPLRYQDHHILLSRNCHQFLKQILYDYSVCKMLQYGCSFHLTWAEMKNQYEKLNLKKAYIIKADIADAFGSIDLTLLKTIISFLKSKYKGSLLKTEYLIKRKLDGKDHCKKIFIFDNMNHKFPNNCIVSAPLSREVIDMPQLFDFAWDYVQCQTVCFGKRNFWIKRGLPQGSLLSSVLCDIYYTNLEHYQMTDFCSNGWLFRYVDDYLFITFDENWARKFLDGVKFGYGKWNCFFSRHKTETNIDSTPSHINYLNYEINPETLGISKSLNMEYDLEKISNIFNKDISWEYFKKIMIRRSKNIKPILLDKRINSMQEISACALKHSFHVAFAFHAILSKSFRNKVKNPKLIDSCVISCYKTVLKRILLYVKGDIKHNEILWLVLKGFLIKLTRHRCMYTQIAKKLHSKLWMVSKRLDQSRIEEFKMIAGSVRSKKS